MPSLRHLQTYQPWNKPYTAEYQTSASDNPLRLVTHDLLHMMKALGRIAYVCEKIDHSPQRNIVVDVLISENLSDFVLCALHIASLRGLDLETLVVETIERVNGIKLPPESPPTSQDPRPAPLAERP